MNQQNNPLSMKEYYEKGTKEEQECRGDFQHKHDAAKTIQKAWRNFRQEIKTVSGENAVQLQRLQATQAEWERQIAALTIQLAWRKFYRHKLLQQVHPNYQQLQLWDPEMVGLKQQAVLSQVYSEQLSVTFWHPVLKPPVRPHWWLFMPSPAAVSYNFAVDQYHPFRLWQRMCSSSLDSRSNSRPH